MLFYRKRFYLPAAASPTYYNLGAHLMIRGWKPTRFQALADFSEAHLQFNEEVSQCLEYKHLLARLVKQYCPEVMPMTYCVNDHNWPQILNQLAHDFYPSHEADDHLIWILKPALLNNGQSIKIFTSLPALEQHFLTHRRLGGEHVLQQYINNPDLLRDQRKYSIRQFMVITQDGSAFLYPKGYYNVALHPFNRADYTDLKAHLTNEHLLDHEPNVIQIPSDQFVMHEKHYAAIKQIVKRLMQGLRNHFAGVFKIQQHAAFALFGIDFMVDNHGRVWLLEANHSPCFPVSDEHPLQAYLYYDFWESIVEGFVLPLATKNKRIAKEVAHFEVI